MSDLQQATERLRLWKEHPARFVRDCFGVDPDPWQVDVLESRDPQQAMTACKGPGKSAVLAWLGWNRLCTRVNCRGVALSITADNLADNLWTELAKWQQKSPFLLDQFQWTATKIFYKGRPELWWLSARSWPRSGNPQQQADSLAGLHGEHVFILMDEAGGIPRSLLATAQAIGANASDWLLALAGNPTNQDSALGFAVLNQRQLWNVTEITADPDDPKRTSRVTREWAQQQIDAWGRDNPWVLVNVFGRFPPSGLNTLLSPDEVRDAQKRHYTEMQYGPFPKILGVDVARFGDDESVIFKRQGKAAFVPLRMRNLDSLQGGSHVAKIFCEWGADSIQIDATGGYGAGWFDQLRGMGYTQALPVQFAGKAHQPSRFYNKRAEMWWDMAQWIKDGGALPPVPEMVFCLSSVTYTVKDGRILVEDKDQIKERIARSPDLEDALACTFAYQIASKPAVLPGFNLPEAILGQQHVHDYDPFEKHRLEVERAERAQYR